MKKTVLLSPSQIQEMNRRILLLRNQPSSSLQSSQENPPPSFSSIIVDKNPSSTSLNKDTQSFQVTIQTLTHFDLNRQYRIVERLGEGHQGVVFKIRNEGDGGCITRYALKIFNPAFYEGTSISYQDEMKRLAVQAGVLQRIYHPNIVKCEYFFFCNHFGCLLMELIRGIELQTLLNYKWYEKSVTHLTEDEKNLFNLVLFYPELRILRPNVILYLIFRLLRALTILHSVGYLHCDIKPNNIMVDRFGTVKLIDLGRAILREHQSTHIFGSPIYMAPETHRDGILLPQSDFYSLGMVLLEMLTGKLIVSEEDCRTSYNLYTFKIELVHKLDTLLPKIFPKKKKVFQILERFIHPKPEKRYESASEAANGIQQLQRLLPSEEQELDPAHGLELYISRFLQLYPSLK